MMSIDIGFNADRFVNFQVLAPMIARVDQMTAVAAWCLLRFGLYSAGRACAERESCDNKLSIAAIDSIAGAQISV